MDEQGFAAYLARTLTPESVRSYLAYGRRIERALTVNLAEALISPETLQQLENRIYASVKPQRSAGNCVSVLRSYASFVSIPVHSASRTAQASTVKNSENSGRARAEHAAKSALQLLQDYAAILEELRGRGIIRTANGPVGDYAEYLFAVAFDWELAGNSSSGYDAVDGEKRRIQIKARRITAHNPSRQLSAMRKLDTRPFHALAAVLFNEAFGVERAIIIPHKRVLSLAKHVEHTNSWRFMLEDRLWELPDCRDVTAILSAAQRRLS